MKRNCLAVLCCLLGITAHSQSFTANLSGNPVNTTGWNYSTAYSSVSDSTFVLTQNVGNEAAYIYYATPENLSAACGQFTVDFDFQIIGNPGAYSTADGISFFYISSPPSGFSAGMAIGLPSNPLGAVMILDTYDNDGNGNNPLETLLGFNSSNNANGYTEGSPIASLCPVVPNENFIDDGQWHHCQIAYTSGVINVYFDNSGTPSLTGNYILNQSGYFGFTASTGGSSSKQSIKDVVISGYGATPPVVTSPIIYCQYAQADTLVATGSGLSWYTAIGGSPLPGSPTPNTAIPDTTYYYVSSGAGLCPSAFDSVKVIVTAQPSTPVITGDTVYCSGSPFVPFNITGQGILWYAADTGGIGSATAPTVNTSVSGSYTFYASQHRNNCASLRDSISVLVYPPTPVPTVTTPIYYCQYEAATSLDTAATGQNLLWYTNPPGAGSAIAPTPVTTTAGTISFYVSQTINGCQSDSAVVDVIVKQKPDLAFNISDTQICLLNNTTLTYTGDAAASTSTYNWILPSNGTLVSGGGTSSEVVNFNTAGIAQVGFNVTDNGCVSNDTTLSITVIESAAPVINFLKDACIGVADQVSYNDVTGNSSDVYNWNFGGGIAIGSGEGPYNVTWNAAGVDTISLSVVMSGCPSDTTKEPVTVHPLPDVHIAALDNNDVCTGDSLQLSASTTEVPVYAYQWMPYSFFATNGMADVYGIIDNPGYIKVQAISDYGCVNTDSVLVTTHPCCDVTLPNAFTPNGDGKNDVFRIIGIRLQKVVEFRIVDRWGKVVYNATDEKGWDGTFDGTPLNIDTYYYYIEYICADGNEYVKKGDVILVR